MGRRVVSKPLGRPLKGASRRIPITVHIPVDTLEAVDKYVSEVAESRGEPYSRSDFYADAAVAFLRSKGVCDND